MNQGTGGVAVQQPVTVGEPTAGLAVGHELGMAGEDRHKPLR
jgi:hypothetical protein